MEMYYVREHTPTCRFLKITNDIHKGRVDYFKESTVGVYPPLHIRRHVKVVHQLKIHKKTCFYHTRKF
jgi:hypothetical protein